MSVSERNRLEVFGRVKRGEMTVVSAAALCGLSLRQGRRVWKRFKELGDAGLVHRLRGRLSNRRMSEELRQRIVKRHQERYADFGPTLACEKLAEEELLVSPDTLVALLKERGLRGFGSVARASTANAGSVACAWDRWCRWMGATTTGLRDVPPSAC